MQLKKEPEIMGLIKDITIRFSQFFIKSMYFIFAIMFVTWLYKYLIFKFVPRPDFKHLFALVFDISFYPIFMIFVMHVVNCFYAGKKVEDFTTIIDDTKSYFQPLVSYYSLLMLAIFLFSRQQGLMIFVLVIMVKLIFVDQLIYYKNYGLMEAIKSSYKLVSMRMFFVFFILGIMAYAMMQYFVNVLIQSYPGAAEYISLSVMLVFVTIIRFFVTVAYREIMSKDYYRSIA